MPIDASSVRQLLPAAVPMVGTLNIDFGDVTYTDAELVLRDQPPFHNHVGGMHAGAMFTLGESASGALVLANFGDLLDTVTPLAVSASIEYLAVAIGDVTARAHLADSPETILAELAAGRRPEFTIDVQLSADGRITGEMSVVWTLRNANRGSTP